MHITFFIEFFKTFIFCLKLFFLKSILSEIYSKNVWNFRKSWEANEALSAKILLGNLYSIQAQALVKISAKSGGLPFRNFILKYN